MDWYLVDELHLVVSPKIYSLLFCLMILEERQLGNIFSSENK
jgi:hypothetical protein